MTVVDNSVVINCLAAGKPSELLGTPETANLDFKATPYSLLTDKQKQEAAKDVSSLANAQGGLIVFGFKTTKEPGRATDRVTSMIPFPVAMFDEDQLRKVLGNWIYPPVEGISFT